MMRQIKLGRKNPHTKQNMMIEKKWLHAGMEVYVFQGELILL